MASRSLKNISQQNATIETVVDERGEGRHLCLLNSSCYAPEPLLDQFLSDFPLRRQNTTRRDKILVMTEWRDLERI